MILIHVDVDNLWIYEKEYGISFQNNQELIYNQSLPTLLDLLKKTNSKVTFMIVAEDLNLSACRSFCRKAIDQGHEIANHSLNHPISFAKLSKKEKSEQITKAHRLLTKVCGKPPIGFRGPGYFQDIDTIEVLNDLNYQYDSSILPGVAHLLMKTYAFLKGGENRYKIFGSTNYLFKRQFPYILSYVNSNKGLLELPISVLPLIRFPIHTTFAYYLGRTYRNLIINYLKTKPKYMLYLFHAIDFINLPKKSNHPIVNLRYSYNERMYFIKSILETLIKANNGPLRTTEDEIQSHIKTRAIHR